MSGAGAPSFAVDGTGYRIAIVASSWHTQVMDGLIDGARTTLSEAHADFELIRVPGSFELPIVVQAALRTYDAAIALGVVIRGGTPHFEFVCEAATAGLNRVGLDAQKPIGFGLLTCDTEDQALDRAGLPGSSENKGREAAEATLMTLAALKRISQPTRA